MRNEQDKNRNEWAQLTQGDYLHPPLQQTYVPEGYAPVQGYAPVEGYSPIQGYAPAGSQDSYPESSNSTRSPYGAYQSQGMNTYTIDGDEVHNYSSSRRQKGKSKDPEQEQLKSKRALRREKVAAENGGEVSATDQPKGLVEWHEGGLFWWDPEDKVFLKAAYHDQYRDQFLAEDAIAEGAYVVAPERGKGANDITSVASAFNQREWRLKDRETWGNIVDANKNRVMYALERPVNQFYDVPERLWLQDDYVLLDGDNNPVRPFAGIPRTFSSKIEGGRIEALRRILPMTIQDFRARMLREVPTAASIGAPTKPLSLPSTFGHRASRFRVQFQCPALTPRAGSEVLKKHVTDLLPGAEEATTEGLQVLTRYEVERRKLSTRGQHLYKGTGRSLTVDERKERDRKLDVRLARQATRQSSIPQRLQSMPATPGESASSSPYLPTPPLSAGNKRCREDEGLEYVNVGQSEPAVKRGRHDASPLDPRLQSPLITPQTLHEDRFQLAPNAYNASGTVGPENAFHGQTGSSTVGLGLDRRGGGLVEPQSTVPSQNTNVPEPPPQQPESPRNKGTASPNDSQPANSEQDYRFLEPQSALDQLSIQAALFYSRAHYYALIGEHPPHTSEGTYTDQYFQIVSLLEQRWLLPGGAPYLADIGPWKGSFDKVPTPTLPDGVVWAILHPLAGADPLPANEEETTDHHDAPEGDSAGSGSGNENVQTVPGSVMAEVENEGDVDEWNDMVTEYLENANGDGDLF